MIELKDFNNIETLKKLKFIDIDNCEAEEILYKETSAVIFVNAIKKLLLGTNTDIKYDTPISEENFYLIAVSLLGYQAGVDFNKENIISFANSIGLSPINDEIYVNADFLENLIDLLKGKTKNGIDYFEKLCVDRAFMDYNDNKEIPEVLIFNGKTQPIFDYNDSIYEKVYVEVPLDTDNDNKRDLIAVYIRRPLETNKGMKVPAIYVASPYMMGCNEDLYKLHNIDLDLEIFNETNIELKDIKCNDKVESIRSKLPKEREKVGNTVALASEEFEYDAITPWYKYFLTRGYAIVLAGGIGTLDSQGVRLCGSVEETISTISVIDWLNKRTKAFSNKTDNLEVTADWCNGNVGMTGKSYLGTLAVAAATTGVDGLKTIVPEAAISNWYEYYRNNGLNVPGLGWQGDDADLLAQYCFSRMLDPDDYKNVKDYFDSVLCDIRKKQDRESGNYNRFWDERNYLNNADKIKASVFIVHGLKDWNVKTKQFDMLWSELEKYDIPRKMILHQGDHIYINNLNGIDFSDIMNKWYGHWLYEIDNGIMEGLPNVMIQNNAYIERWDKSTSWPFDGAKYLTFYVDNNNKLTNEKENYIDTVKFLDDLNLTGYDRQKPDENIWLNSIVNEPGIQKPFRLSYVSKVLTEDIVISGNIKFKMEANINNKTGIISAMIVDYGLDCRTTLELKKVKSDAIIYGINAGTDDLVDFVMEENPTNYNVITRGWMCAQNRRNNYNKDEVVINKDYSFSFEMQPMNYTLKKGHRLGLIVYSTDVQATQRPFKVTEFTIHKESIIIEVPIVS